MSCLDELIKIARNSKLEELYRQLDTNKFHIRAKIFGILDWRIKFLSNSNTLFDWIVYFLHPCYQIFVDLKQNIGTVYAIEGIRTGEILKSVNGGELFQMYPDTKGLLYELQGGILLANPLNSNFLYVIHPLHKSMIVIGETLSDNRSRLRVHHLIRTIFTRKLEEQNVFMFHAGAIKVAGKYICLAGAKGKGKTTLVINFLSQLHTDFMSGDRIYVGLRNGGKNEIWIHNVPVSFKIGVGTMLHVPELRQLLRDYEFFNAKSGNIKKENLWYNEAKISFTDKEIASIFGVNILLEGRMDALVFPDLNPNSECMEIHKLSKNEAGTRIYNSFPSFHDPLHPDWQRFRKISEQTWHREVEKVCKAIVENVPCYEVKGGTDSGTLVNEICKIV